MAEPGESGRATVARAVRAGAQASLAPKPGESGRATVARAVRAGAQAGLALAVGDAALTRAAYASLGERALLWIAVAALLVAAGATVGLAVGTAAATTRRRGPLARAAAITLATLPWWLAAGHALGTGPRIRAQLGAAAPWLGALAACALALGASRIALLALAGARSPRARRRLAAAAALLGAALLAADALAFHRRFSGLHGLEVAGAFASLALAAAALQTPRQAPSRRSAALTTVAVAALAALAFALEARSQNLRFVARQQTTAARQLHSALAAAAALWPAPVAAGAPRAPRRRPDSVPLPVSPDAHLVLITVDALRPDHTSPYGYPRTVAGAPLTPTLDDLARRGVRFARTYAQAPHSAYSIASLLSSDYVAAEVELGAPPGETLADVLGARGFRTEAFFPLGLFFNGRTELSRFADRKFGFQHAVTWDLDAPALTDEVLRHLDQIRRDGEPRTFLWVHYFDVHEPYLVHPGLDLGETPEDRYDSEIAFFDRELARLLAGLAQLDRPSVVALTADHGEEFKEHGGWYHGSSLYEEQVRVPLIVVAPGLAPRVVEGPVELVDVAPMLLGLVGQAPAAGMRGDDLSPALAGAAEPERPVFAEVDTKRMVARRGWKLIHDVRRDTWELYDLDHDPREQENVYDRRPEVARDLEAELHRFLESLGDRGGTREPEALSLARLGDAHAAAGLAALIADRTQNLHQRAEAARLAGALEGYPAKQALRDQLPLGVGALPPGAPLVPIPPGTPCDEVCAESALALGELTDRRAVPTLVRLLDEPRYNHRAAVALGRLREPAAAPALPGVLADPDPELRRHAVHYLGFVGGPSAIAPLEARFSDLKARYLIGPAIARIAARAGSASDRASVLAFLGARLGEERFEDNRAYLICALGLLGDPGGLPAALAAARRDPPVRWATESLVRLGALRRGTVAGVDFSPARAGLVSGFSNCRAREAESTDDYAGATTCSLDGAGRLHFPRAQPGPATIALRIAPRTPGAKLALSLNGTRLAAPALEAGWHELRIEAPASAWRLGENQVDLDVAGGAEVDHLLALPR